VVDVGAPSQAVSGVPGGYGEFLLTSLLVLVAVCVLAWLAVRFGLRRLGTARADFGPVRVVGRVGLEPRRTVYVIEAAGRHLLVATSEAAVSVLAELDGQAVEAALGAQPRPRSFADALRLAMGRRRGASAGAGAQRAAGEPGGPFEASSEPSGPLGAHGGVRGAAGGARGAAGGDAAGAANGAALGAVGAAGGGAVGAAGGAMGGGGPGAREGAV
jgi:flagellar biogenesis protein FliO